MVKAALAMVQQSVAGRLVLSASVLILVLLSICGGLFWYIFDQHLSTQVMERLSSQLTSVVESVSIKGDQGLHVQRSLLDVRFDHQYSGLYWVVWAPHHKSQLLRSQSLGEHILNLDGVLPVGRDPVVWQWPEDHDDDRAPLGDEGVLAMVQRIDTLNSDGPVYVLVAIDVSDMEEAQESFASVMLYIFAALFVSLIAGMVWQVRYGLRPLAVLRRDLTAVHEGRLGALESTYPIEVAPLVTDLNHIMAQHRERVEKSRQTAGDLAHGLKTPLTILENIMTNWPAAQKGGSSVFDHQKSVELRKDIKTQLDNMRRLTDYHLATSRAAAAADIMGQRCHLNQRVTTLSRVMSMMYPDRPIEVIVELPRDVWLYMDARDLDEVIGNLLDNAMKWAHKKVRVSLAEPHVEVRDRVNVGTMPKFVTVCIEDDGPGLSEQDTQRVTQRGVRLDETKPGTGLGLSIVHGVVMAYKGNLDFMPASTEVQNPGLMVCVSLPEAPV